MSDVKEIELTFSRTQDPAGCYYQQCPYLIRTSSTVSLISPDRKAVMALATPRRDPATLIHASMLSCHQHHSESWLTSTHSGPPPPPNPSASGSASTHFMLLVSSGYQRSPEALQILFISLLLMRERGNLPSLQFLPFYPSVELSNL
jgi:hypothetical protein